MEIDKIEAFDYMLHLFEEWRDNHETIKGKPFPKLTAMKLLFLAAAPKKDGGDDLLDIFDNFYAMPYGPVESDVYNAFRKTNFLRFRLNIVVLNQEKVRNHITQKDIMTNFITE